MFLWLCNLIYRQKMMNRNCNILKKERGIPFPCRLMGVNTERHMRGHWRKRWDMWGWSKISRVWKAIDEYRECEGTQRLQRYRWCLWRTELKRLRGKKNQPRISYNFGSVIKLLLVNVDFLCLLKESMYIKVADVLF